MKRFAITFVLPGDNRSGGVRVTALMANLLRDRGHQVRIAHPAPPRLSFRGMLSVASKARERIAGQRSIGWLHRFSGPVERYTDINDIRFCAGEVVIAVGTYMIRDVFNIRDPAVVKVRYNHGFPRYMTDAFRESWSLPMTTITVANTLVPKLEQLSGHKVLAVIPNGIDTSEYYPVAGIARNAVGTIFSVHPNKAPEDIVALMNRVGQAFPQIPRIVFGADRQPHILSGCRYERYPSVKRARELYSQSLIWLLASHTEGLPGPVLEAMACGAAVISTDNDGSVELIEDNQNGMLVRKRDIASFIDRIGQVLEDDGLRMKIVKGGFDTVAKFTWTAAAERMEDFLDLAVGQ